MTIRSKAALENQIQDFADGSGITADQLRDYLHDILDSKLIQLQTYTVYPGPTKTLTEDDIDENIVHVTSSPIVMEMPEATVGLLGRKYVHLHTTSDSIEFAATGTDTIVGNNLTARPASITCQVTDLNQWTVFELPLQNVAALSNFGDGLRIDTVPDDPVIQVRPSDRVLLNEDSSTSVSTLTQNVWSDIDANWTQLGTAENFTPGPDSVAYGGDGHDFQATLNVRGRSSAGGASRTQYEIALAVNGVTQPGHGIIVMDGNDDDGGSLITLLNLANGDVVTPQVRNVENNNDLQLEGITLLLTEWR